MNDCKLVITVRDGMMNMEGKHMSIEELAAISGYLQVFVGTEGLQRGLDLDEVKGNMLDIYLAAMDMLELANKNDDT